MDERILPRTLPEPLVASIDETARISGLSRSRIYELLEEGQLRSTKIGRRRLVIVASIRELLQLDTS